MPKSRKPRRKASRKTSRKGKKCPPGCVKKTLKRSRKSLKRSRRRVSRKASRKRRSVKRKVSRKRRSVKRKVSRKRRSVKRKVSRKRKSAKRKASRKRRSVKRKASRKKKSAKRKASRKRRSVKRKASRKKKSAKRKSRKRKSAKRKSRKRKSAKRKSRKSNFGFFTQRMRDSMRRKYQRTKDRLGRTFRGKNYIAPHEFLPARKLPANLYPIFIHRFPKFRGRNPSESPIIFKAKPGETASTFKRRIDSLFKNYRQQMYKKNYILARRGGYTGSMKDHIEDYKAKQAQEAEKQAKEAHQKMVRLANLQAAQKESKLRKQCEFIQKQIQRAPKGPRRAALEKDFATRCAKHKRLIMRNTLAAKRRGAFIASAKSFKKLDKEDVARIREELDKYKRACAAKGRNFSGRKDKLGRYVCDGAAILASEPGARGLRHRLPPGAGIRVDRQQQNVGRRYLEKAAEAQWNSVPLNEKIRRCQRGEAKLKAATTAKNNQLIRVLTKNLNDKNCNHWIAQREKAPTNPGSSYF